MSSPMFSRATIAIVLLAASERTNGFLVQKSHTRITRHLPSFGLSTRTPTCKRLSVALADVSSNDTSIETTPSTQPNQQSEMTTREQIKEFGSIVTSANSYELAVRASLAAQRLFEQEDPTTHSLNAVLNMWSKVAQKLAEWHNSNNNKVTPIDTALAAASIEDSSAMGEVLKNVNVGEAGVYTTKDAAIHAEALLNHHLDKATTTSFNAVMDCWTKSRDEMAPEQVQTIFDQIKSPDESSYNALVETYAYAKDVPYRITKLEGLKVKYSDSTRTCNALLHAYSKAAIENPRAATEISDKALAALEALKETYQRTRNPIQRPDMMSYTTGSTKYLKIADQLMEDAKAGCSDSSTENRFRPSSYAFTTLIRSWGRTNTPEAVERCFEILDDSIEWTGPHVNAFTCLIQVLGKTQNAKQPAERSLKLLQRMRSLSVVPTIITYNSALEACSKQTEENTGSALKIAFAIFKAIEQPSSGVSPDEWTYSALMGCVGRLLPASEERNNIATMIFQKAVAAQMVSRRLLQQLINACDSSVFYELLCHEMMPNQNGKFDFDAIPLKWAKRTAAGSKE